jgi:hypothetical protein
MQISKKWRFGWEYLILVSSRDAMELCEGDESHAGSNTHYNHGFLIPQVHGQGGESE